MSQDASLKEKVDNSIEKLTVDKLVGTNRMTDEEFIISLFEMDTDNNTATKATAKLREAAKSEETIDEDVETDEVLDEEKTECESVEVEVIPKAEIVQAEEVSAEMVRAIKNELMEEIKAKGLTVIDSYNDGRCVRQEEFYKIQLWSFFPVVGIPVYFFFLCVLSANVRGKYTITMQNFAKAQLRTFWAYLIAHISVLFVAYYSIVSFIHIINRGLAGL